MTCLLSTNDRAEGRIHVDVKLGRFRLLWQRVRALFENLGAIGPLRRWAAFRSDECISGDDRCYNLVQIVMTGQQLWRCQGAMPAAEFRSVDGGSVASIAHGDGGWSRS